jgi:rhodanese-related sulfurtransferase
MSARPTLLSPNEVADRLARGRAVLVDVREADEFARRRVKGAVSRPLSALEPERMGIEFGREVVFTCRSGQRTAVHWDRLRAAAGGDAFVLDGGLEAWAAAGLPVEVDRKAPLELMRQVQIAAGVLVLLGVALGFAVSPAFFGVSAFVGAGLTFAGVSGFCGMARLLAMMPWNRRATA